jgi:hypothetical protein
MRIMTPSREVSAASEPLPWRFSTQHLPGYYYDKFVGWVYWSGTPRHVTSNDISERNAAAVMRAWNYNAECLPPSYPVIDIQSSKAVAQVKNWSTAVGPTSLILLYKRYGETGLELWFFAAESGYTPAALHYANKHNILLFTYSITGKPTPVNPIAEKKFKQLEAQRYARLLHKYRFDSSRKAGRKWIADIEEWQKVRSTSEIRKLIDERRREIFKEQARERRRRRLSGMSTQFYQSLPSGYFLSRSDKPNSTTLTPVIPTGAFSISEEIA